MEKLTSAEIMILEKELKNSKLYHIILLGLTGVAIVTFLLSQYLDWGFPARLISGFFGIALAVFSLIHYFMIKNIICELANGVKTSIEGAIIKKEMKVGPNEYKLDYSKESLEKLAQYIEDKEKGVTTDNSISAYNLSRDAKASFLITLADKSDYSVGIRNYINMEVGDKVRIEFTPLSRTFLNATKL